ncbi:MAG: phage shock protein PspC (stress-responsive transcriptional regulator) [Cyclobacteriaceae bacterium]|jgi:phage shock protein PspC (stress-responsive transcriptional regulator)
MKKTISINIGGIIFHIEEDAYDQLKSYLDSVNKYFASFDDNQEIISDIESRIGELFINKLADGRQTINIEDVDELISTMGTTKDFEATFENEAEEQSNKKSKPEQSKESQKEETQEENNPTDKRLYRDTKRKMLGGVASGFAHYFRIDPLWIRLLILALFVNIIFFGFSFAILLSYIILWVVLPPNEDLPEDKKIKKLYRNNEQRVLGGVAGGLASYFGTDSSVIRLLFVLSIFIGGAGILVYIVLWIITPEARTITQKMQMQGEPVTLSNIEQNVKKGLKVKDGEENPIVKILLFPFRVISTIIQTLSKILGPALKLIVEIIRIGFGALIILIGFSFMIAFITVLLGLSGYGFVNDYLIIGELPIDLVNRTINIWVVVFSFLVVFIPAVSLALLGLVVILKRRVANAYIGWSMFALWTIGLIGTSLSIPNLVREFRSKTTVRSEQIFPATKDVPTLKLNYLEESVYEGVSLRLKGHEDSVFQAMLTFESRGSSKPDATSNAENINYNIDKKGNDFLFDSNITFPENANFRMQEVDITFYIPYGQKFRMERDLEDILISTISINGYKAYQMEGNDWVFERGGLKCLTCQGFNYDNDRGNIKSNKATSYSDTDQLTYPFEDFTDVKIASFFDIDIIQGAYSVVLKGDNKDLDEVYLNQVGNRLEVKFKDDNWKWWKDNYDRKIKVVISMPKLVDLEIEGACKGTVYGFNERDMNISISGASEITLDANVSELDISLRGASTLELKGTGDFYDVSLDGASEFKAASFRAKRIRINADGASKASIFATDEIKIEANGMSDVKYEGTRNVSIDENGMSSVRGD